MYTALKPKQTRYHRLLAELQPDGTWALKHSSFLYDHQDLQQDPDVKAFENKRDARAYMAAFKVPHEPTIIDRA